MPRSFLAIVSSRSSSLMRCWTGVIFDASRLALCLPLSCCYIQVRNDLVATSNFLSASDLDSPCRVINFIASSINSSSVIIRRGIRFKVSPNKLIKLPQLARPENRDSLVHQPGLHRFVENNGVQISMGGKVYWHASICGKNLAFRQIRRCFMYAYEA